MDSRSVASAFEMASQALRFSFKRDFIAHGHRFVGLVRDFGGRRGTIVIADGEELDTSVLEQLAAEGYHLSVVTRSYEYFDEALFQDTLNDWGYRGDLSARPDWCTGKLWP
jgi:hypothetical protein